MNVLKLIAEKLSARTLSSVIASLIWSVTSTLIREFNTIKGKSRNELLEIIALMELTADDEYRPTLERIIELVDSAPEEVTLPDELDEATVARMKKRGKTRAQLEARIKANHQMALERYETDHAHLMAILPDLEAEFNKAVERGPNLDYKYSADMQARILETVLDKLDDRYESLVAQSVGARGKYAKRVDEEMDEIDAVFITLDEAA